MPLAQDGVRLAAIVIAVVKKEDDLAANLLLEPARGRDFGVEKSLREKAARLLTEADDRLAHAGRDGALRRPSEIEWATKPDERQRTPQRGVPTEH